MRLNNALMFWNAAASMVKTHFGRQDERFVTYLRGIANSSYLLSRNPEMMAELGSPQFRNELAINRVHLGETKQYESRDTQAVRRHLLKFCATNSTSGTMCSPSPMHSPISPTGI